MRQDQFADKLTNPASLTIQWAGGSDAGYLKAYDKETKERIELKPLSFVVLKEKNCLDGYLAAKNSGAWSNEVSNLKTEALTVMYKDNGDFKVFKEGMYADIVEEMKVQGVKYHKVIYAMVVDSPDIKGGEVVRLLLKGAAASAWFELKAEYKKGVIALTGSSDGQTGAVKYKVPTFGAQPITEEANAQAEIAYDSVEAYLKSRKVDAPEVAEVPVEDDQAPF